MGWLYIIAGVVLLTVLVWLEVKRANKARLTLRLIASVIAVTSICWLAFPGTTDEKPLATPTVENVLPPYGITSCNWPLQVTAGGELEVNGIYHNRNGKKLKLLLSGFDTPMDSTVLEGKGPQSFSLRTRPAHKGRALYRITVLEGQHVLEQEPLPVEVLPGEKLQVLLLSSSPDFEDRFLADWLAQQSYPVASRSLISRNQYATRFLNLPQQPLDMSKFDVIIADAAAMLPAERLQVNRRVEEDGAGLLIKQDSTGLHPQPVKLQVLGEERYIDPLPLDPATHLTAAGMLPLVKDSAGHTYTAIKLQGMGRVVHTAIHNTYTWQLNGHSAAYEQYWSALLQQLARKNRQQERWRFTPAITRVNEPLSVQLQTPFAGGPKIVQSDVILAPGASPVQPNTWLAACWPSEKGWVQFKTEHSDRWVYVFGQDDWKHTYHANVLNTQEISEKRSMIKWWLIIPLLFSLVFLWVERKL